MYDRLTECSYDITCFSFVELSWVVMNFSVSLNQRSFVLLMSFKM